MLTDGSVVKSTGFSYRGSYVIYIQGQENFQRPITLVPRIPWSAESLLGSGTVLTGAVRKQRHDKETHTLTHERAGIRLTGLDTDGEAA